MTLLMIVDVNAMDANIHQKTALPWFSTIERFAAGRKLPP